MNDGDPNHETLCGGAPFGATPCLPSPCGPIPCGALRCGDIEGIEVDSIVPQDMRLRQVWSSRLNAMVWELTTGNESYETLPVPVCT